MIPIVSSTAILDSIKLSHENISLGVGESIQVVATGHFSGNAGSFTAVIDTLAAWSSDNEKVAKVEKGVVTALDIGQNVAVVVFYKDKADTLLLTSHSLPSIVKRLNFQVTSQPHSTGWFADDGSIYSAARSYGWVTPGDIQVKRDDRSGTNYLFKTFIKTARPTDYRINVPDGEYIIRIGMGDISWGDGIYSWACFGNDTLCRKEPSKTYVGMPRYCNIETKTIQVTGGNGITLTVNNFLCYLIVSSTEQGYNVLCEIAKDDFSDPACKTPIEVITMAENEKLPTISISPNPANPICNINIYLPTASTINLGIYDLSGRLIKTIVTGKKSHGFYSFSWDANDGSSSTVSTGVYICRMDVGTKSLYKKAVFMR